MKKHLLTLLLLTATAASMQLAAQNADLIPQPREMEQLNEPLILNDQLKGDLATAQRTRHSSGNVTLARDAGLPAEGYRLNLAGNAIRIDFGSEAGLTNAFATLQQLRELNAGSDKLPGISIKDYPEYEHRALMLDVSRHFFDKEEVKKILDIMALYKLNRFHWHLTDDQGWRIEIPEYPKLTEVGAVRDSSLTNKGRQPFFYDDTPYGKGCFYTLDDLREVVAYARERGIEIIPEIDLPGHMVAAVASYPELGCNPNKKVSVRVFQGVSKEVLNVGDDRVLDFLRCVLSHIAEVFPYKYIHLGGDECPTDEWKTNALALKRVKDKGLKGVEELQSWLVEELGTFLNEKYGKELIVWDELLAHWNDANRIRPVIMCWRGLDYTTEAGRRGFKCISVPNYHMYLDLIQMPADKADVNEVYQGGYGPKDVNTVEHIYRTNPVEKMAADTKQFCIGTQANLWTESCSSNEQAEYQILPRMLALSETAWLPAESKDWDRFYRRLQSHAPLLDRLGYTYAKHYIEPQKLTEEEQARQTAEQLLKEGKAGKTGYPSTTAYRKLKIGAAGSNVAAAVAWFKKQPLTTPVEGKVYRLVSASTFYLAKYAGSTVYAKTGEGLHLHYTPQDSDSELWRCTIKGKTFTLTNVGNPTVKIDGLTLLKPTEPHDQYDYVSGTILLQRTDGKLLNANSTGCVGWGEEQKVCGPGTWRLEEAE